MMTISCSYCNSTDGFDMLDDCYLVCIRCRRQVADFITDTHEYEMDKDGKSRFGMLSDRSTPLLDATGNVMLDTSLPFERPSRTSVGSAVINDATRRVNRAVRVHHIVEEVVDKLVDPLYTDHSIEVVQRVRRTCLQMLTDLFRQQVATIQDDDEHHRPAVAATVAMKNRGMRKKAIFAHTVTRVLLKFVPEYDDKKYLDTVLTPYFAGSPGSVIHKYMQKYGVPMFRDIFPSFDRGYEHDFAIHLRCKVRRIFRSLVEHGQFRALLSQPKHEGVFEVAGRVIFHPSVEATLQSWDFVTRTAVIMCALGLTTPEEAVQIILKIDDNCVKPATIHQKLRLDITRDIIQSVMSGSADAAASLREFQRDKALTVVPCL
jgi:hypothetical protein